ncbi:DegT/DnrJ/EryC1/StrS family aminotransferase [Stappia indica]|uniref:DegT/DnrJ/EryC1/StrS family aminotransferase n=1 Tax=Stappia indica TaxID=538381 RepID=UPI001CD7D9C5|nr:DegT/DnrJ/EryC1/StrS family aminotransferase [Stappia indica]MCA1300788.1 DegT/DnrJ/EryC1/StrS family aminotransferase [Stappia indica]
MQTDTIPLCDLKAQYASIKDEIAEAVGAVLESCAYIKGPQVAAFEAAFAARHGLDPFQAIGCSNGTSALTVALKALDLPAGGEVILPSHTFFATAESVLLAGLVPVFADICAHDYTIDPSSVERLVGPRTVAIVPVHIYGGMADMDALSEIARRNDLKLVEDCAQAHLATRNGRTAGTIGDAGTYSFYPGKNLGAYGDAGMVVARDPAVAERIRKLVDHGRQDKYLHDLIGDNLRIDTLQAAILDVKLRHLDEWTAARRAVAERYDAALKPAGFKVIEPPAGSAPVYHLYIVEVANRQKTLDHLKAQGISAGIHYPVPVHRQPALAGMGLKCDGDLPTTERIAGRIVSLPIYPEMTEAQIERVVEQVLHIAI